MRLLIQRCWGFSFKPHARQVSRFFFVIDRLSNSIMRSWTHMWPILFCSLSHEASHSTMLGLFIQTACQASRFFFVIDRLSPFCSLNGARSQSQVEIVVCILAYNARDGRHEICSRLRASATVWERQEIIVFLARHKS
jgi:hypothetical protein